jgi:hypothetical protein
MHLLFPRFHPVAIGLYFCALGVCFVFGGTSSGEVLFAIDPFSATAIALAAAQVGTKVVQGLQKAKTNKTAIANFMGSPEYKAMSAQQQAAALRAEADRYGLNAAARRRLGIESGKDYKAKVAETKADLKSGMADPTKMAQSRELVDRIAKGASDTAVQATAAAEEQSGKLALGQKAQDLGVIKGAAAQRSALEQGLAAARNLKTDAISGGIQDAASIGADITMSQAGQASGKRAEAGKVGEGVPDTPTSVPPGSTNTGGAQ